MSINKEYVKYLEELGFQKCSLEQIKAYVPCEFEYIYNAYWFMYDGDLVLDRLEMKNLPLLVTGDLTMDKGVIVTECNNGLVVLGTTKVKSVIANGNTYFSHVEFSSAFITSGNGPPRHVKRASGPFLYSDSDSASIGNTDDVKVLFDEKSDEIPNYKVFFETVVNPHAYIEEAGSWQCQSRDDYEKEFTDGEFEAYEEYLFTEIGVNSSEMEAAIFQERFEIKL